MDRFRRLPRTSVLGFEAPVASTLRSRLLGLALIPADRAPRGLLIPHCRAVHTFGMRFPLDLVFLDRHGLVLELRRDVAAGRMIRCPRAASVLELPAPAATADSARFGAVSDVEGHRVEFDFELTFSNGGGMQGQAFRMDIAGEEIGDEELVEQFVREHRLLLVEEMRVLRKRIIREPHNRTPG